MSKDKHIPQGYKDSPLGIIPKEWEVKRLGDIADITSGTTPLRSNSKYYNNGVIPWVKTTDLNNGTLYETEEKVSKEAVEKTSLRILPKGTVLVAMYGGFRQIGRTALLGIDATINQALSALMCKSSVESPFVLAWLNCRVNYWKRLAASSRKDPNITGNEVAKFPILIPSKEEQGCIVEVLGLWDTAIEKQSELIEKLNLRKRALMQQLLTGKKRLPGFSGEWKEVRLGEVCTLIKGTQINSDSLVKTGLYPVINGGINPSGYNNEYNTEANTITISEGGNSCGYVNLIKTRFWSGGHCYTLSKLQKVELVFLYYVLKHMELHIMNLRVGSGLPNIQTSPLLKFNLRIPTIEEQTAIGSILVNADKEIELANKKLNNLQSQKRGLMQQLLTGKKRVSI